MTEDRLPLAELLAKAGDGDFLRSVAEAVVQLLMETDVEGRAEHVRADFGRGAVVRHGTLSAARRHPRHRQPGSAHAHEPAPL